MGLVIRQRLTATQLLAQEWARAKSRVKELWQERLVPSRAQVAEIIAGTYEETGSSGAGELNGVPTAEDVRRIIAGTYVHYEPQTDEFAIEDVPSEEDVRKIIAGTY